MLLSVLGASAAMRPAAAMLARPLKALEAVVIPGRLFAAGPVDSNRGCEDTRD
jgi:hypothetical protein